MYLGEWAHLVLAELPGYGLDEIAAGGEGDDGEGCAQHTQLLRRAQDVFHGDILENFKTRFNFLWVKTRILPVFRDFRIRIRMFFGLLDPQPDP